MHLRSRTRLRRARDQQGISLIDLSIWAAIAIAITIGGMWVQVENLRVERATQQGQDLAEKRDALDNYITQYQSEVMNNTPVPGVGNVRQPTMTELSALGFLPTGSNNQNYYAGSYITRIRLVPAACTPPACNIEGFVIMSTPVLGGDGAPSELLASYAAKAVGSGGGYSSSGTGTNALNITGMNASWTFPNPIGPVGARTRGIVAAQVFTGTSSMSVFLRRDGSDTGMTGDLQMNNNNITNADQVTSRRLSATEIVAAGQHVLAAQDISSVNGNVIARIGNVEARAGNLVARNGWTIANDGLIENARLPNGSNARLSQAVFYSHIMASGATVNKPTCPAGSVPQVFGTAVSKATNPPKAIFGEYIETLNLGASWLMRQWLLTSTGWTLANPAASFIKVDVKCS